MSNAYLRSIGTRRNLGLRQNASPGWHQSAVPQKPQQRLVERHGRRQGRGACARGRVLANVTFRVREKARQQVIERECRQVHCWAMSTLVDGVSEGARTAISCNLYHAGTFTQRSDGSAVNACEFVHFTKEEGAVAVG